MDDVGGGDEVSMRPLEQSTAGLVEGGGNGSEVAPAGTVNSGVG